MLRKGTKALQILFQNLVHSFCLATALWVMCRGQAYFNVQDPAEISLEVNCTPLSKTILSGRLCSLTISFMKIFAVSITKGVPNIGRKCAIFDNSITTKMVLNSFKGANSTIKSIGIFCQGCSTTDSGLNKPQDLVLDPLLRWQAVQELTYFIQSSFKCPESLLSWKVFRT